MWAMTNEQEKRNYCLVIAGRSNTLAFGLAIIILSHHTLVISVLVVELEPGINVSRHWDMCMYVYACLVALTHVYICISYRPMMHTRCCFRSTGSRAFTMSRPKHL